MSRVDYSDMPKWVDAVGSPVRPGAHGWVSIVGGERVVSVPCFNVRIECSDCDYEFECGELAFEV